MATPRRAVGPTTVVAVGFAGLGCGLGLAFLTREERSPVVALILLLAGTALVLAGTAWLVRAETRPRGLVIEPGTRLPRPAWWLPVTAVGVIDLTAGAAVSGWVGLVGAILVVDGVVEGGRALLAPPPEIDRGVVRAARRLRAAGGAGPPLIGALEPTGRSGVRVVVVDADGSWVDVVLANAERANVAADLAGVELRDQANPSFSSAFALGPSAWSRLAGPS